MDNTDIKRELTKHGIEKKKGYDFDMEELPQSKEGDWKISLWTPWEKYWYTFRIADGDKAMIEAGARIVRDKEMVA